MKATRTITAIMFALTIGFGVSACEEHKGPAERAGEKIDHATEDVKDAAHDAKKKLKDAADDIEDKVDD